jgi:integrase
MLDESLAEVVPGKAIIFVREGIWQARIYTGDRRYLWRSLKTRDKQDAIAKCHMLYQETLFKQKHGLPVVSRTLEQTVDAFEVWYINKQNSSSDMKRQVQRVMWYIKSWAPNKGINTIRDAEMEAYVEWRRVNFIRKPPSDKSIHFEVTIFRMMLKWAHRQGWMGNTPLPDFTYTPKHIRVRPAFELDQWRAFYRALRSYEQQAISDRERVRRGQFRDFCLIIANSGLRPGEAYNLRIRDVQPISVGDHSNYRLVVRGKTGERDVIPRRVAVRYIQRQLQRREGAEPDEPLFPNETGARATTYMGMFRRVIAHMGGITAADRRTFSLYSLRHTYAIFRLRYSNVSVWDIARNMGTSIMCIQNYYGKQATPLSVAHRLQE